MKTNLFKRKKKKDQEEEIRIVENPKNEGIYGQELDEIQEYHNPYLTVKEFFNEKNIEKKNLN